MSKLSELKDFINDQSKINCNVAYPMVDSVVAEVIEDVDAFLQVATPVASPVAGEVAAEAEVTLTCATEGAIIYYTLDDSAPTNANLVYTNAIVVTEPTTIKAIAYKGYQTPSAILTAAYTIAL